jgi:hypothetical protein
VGHLFILDGLSTCRPDWLQEVLLPYDNDQDSTELLQELTVKSSNDRWFCLEQSIIKYKGRLMIGANLALQTKLIASLK